MTSSISKVAQELLLIPELLQPTECRIDNILKEECKKILF